MAHAEVPAASDTRKGFGWPMPPGRCLRQPVEGARAPHQLLPDYFAAPHPVKSGPNRNFCTTRKIFTTGLDGDPEDDSRDCWQQPAGGERDADPEHHPSRRYAGPGVMDSRRPLGPQTTGKSRRSRPRHPGMCPGLKADGRGSKAFGPDCCQYCCQAARQRLPCADGCGMPVQRTDRHGRSRTTCPLLRIRSPAVP